MTAERSLPNVAVVTSVYNEETHIQDWLERSAWAGEQVVVDSGSTDRTGEIASRWRDRFPEKTKLVATTNKLMFNINKNHAFEQATREWVLLLDGDERASDALVAEIEQLASDPNCPYTAFWIPRRTYVMGRFVRAWYPGYQLRLFRRGKARYACKDMHEHLEVDGPIGYLKADLLHYTEDSIAERVHKSNYNSEHWAGEQYRRRYRFRRWMLVAQPLMTFLDYFLRRGLWRDGVFGFILAVNGSYSIFLRYAKLWAAYNSAARVARPSDRLPATFDEDWQSEGRLL